MAGVLVVMEQRLADGRAAGWHPVSLEAVSAGRELAGMLGCECSALVLGAGAAELAAAPAMGLSGLAKVYVAEHELLATYTADGYVQAVKAAVELVAPTHVVFPHTYQVRDFVPALATRLGQEFLPDVVALKSSDAKEPVFVRQLFGGKLNAEYGSSEGLTFLSVQAGAFAAAVPEGGAPEVVAVPVALDAAAIRTEPGEPFREAARTVDLSAASVIVSVGRGIGEQENLAIVEALASALGAEIAASRPICDAGWLPMERQVGSSGQTVAPKVYFAVGISGAIQHLVGMKGAKTVIAINKDADAPIFEVTDVGVVGDLFEIVPALVKQLAVNS